MGNDTKLEPYTKLEPTEHNGTVEQLEELQEAVRRIALKAHEYDQTGPADDNRFAELKEMAWDALKS